MFGVDLLHRKVMLLMLFSIFILGFIHLKKLSLRCIPQLRTHSNNKNCSCTVHSLKLLFRVHMQCAKVSISSSSSHRSSSICTDLNECGWVGLQLHSLLTIASYSMQLCISFLIKPYMCSWRSLHMCIILWMNRSGRGWVMMSCW